MALLSFVFVSCGNEDENPLEKLTGKMDITIDGESKTFPTAHFLGNGNKTVITAGTINITIDKNPTGEYTLGFGKDANTAANEIVSNGISTISSGHTLIYTPAFSDVQTSVYGLLTITEATDNKLVGSFSVAVVELSILTGLDLTNVLSILNGSSCKKITGTFTAVNYIN